MVNTHGTRSNSVLALPTSAIMKASMVALVEERKKEERRKKRKKERKKERKSTLLSVITGTKQPLSSPGADDQSEGLTRDLSNHRFPTTLI